jgi:hypothetical protein
MLCCKNLEGCGCGLIDTLSRNVPGGTEEVHKTVFMINCVETEVRTDHPRLRIESVTLELHVQ